jgi:hydroxymethylpyrimidine pyrophosphatase-like HAD family hydrolase
VKRISFDIDGTLEVGDPPSLVTMDMVRAIKALGYVIGSGSGRPLRYQRHILENHHIVVDFMALKHQLADVKAQLQAEAMLSHGRYRHGPLPD